MMISQQKQYKLGIFYGPDPDTVMLAQKFVGNLINDDEFCKACELLEKDVKCDKCREYLGNFSSSIYFYDLIGENVPDFIEDPEEYLPKTLPQVDFLLVVGIHQDLLSGLPEYLKDANIKAVIIPIENPKWVQPGLQVQVLEDFERLGIQASFPKPFCAMSKDLNEYNKVGFNLTKNHDNVIEFIDYYKIGEPIVSFILSDDGKSILDTCVLQSAPCGSTFYILQQLKAKYIEDDELSLNERISKAHHSYPCNASMDKDLILKDSILHIGGILVRDAVRNELGLKEHEGRKEAYVANEV